MDEEDLWDDEETIPAYLLFNLGAEVYGIPIAQIISIIEVQKITEVPDMPPSIRGVINLRGTVLPVMDLRLRFGLAERAYDDRTCIIIARVQDKPVGFLCDTVNDVQAIAPEDIAEPVTFQKDAEQTRYISGLTKVGGSVRVLLDVEKVFSDKVAHA